MVSSCFKSQNRTYFTYSDQQHNNVYVYDFFTQNYFPVSPYDCTCQDCPQLLLLENQYLVICDANHDLVLDTHTNFSLIINISNGIADILAVLHGNVTTLSPPIISTLTNSLDFYYLIIIQQPSCIKFERYRSRGDFSENGMGKIKVKVSVFME